MMNEYIDQTSNKEIFVIELYDKPEKDSSFYTGRGYIPKKAKRKTGFDRYGYLYEAVIQLLPADKNTIIVDLGCGVGFFSKYVFDKGYKNYIGIDFSEQALDLWKSKDDFNYKFVNGDLRDPEVFKDYNEKCVFVCLETLEHVKNDLQILQNIPKGSLVIISLPKLDAKGHVRYFLHIKGVINRYYKYLHFDEIKDFGNIFLLKTKKLETT